MISKYIEMRAKQLYARDKANGTVKPQRVMAVSVSRSGGQRTVVASSEPEWHRYLFEARRDARNEGV